jgi:hypothetical protein
VAKKGSTAPAAAQPEFGPAESAAALEKLYRRSAPIAGAAELVARWADRTIEACPNPSDKTFIERSQAQLVGAIASLDALGLSKGTRLAIDTAIRATFTIGRMLGDIEQALAARKGMRPARVEPAQQRQALIVPDQLKRALEIIRDKGWSLDKGQKKATIEKVAMEMGVSERTIYRWLATRK